MSTEKEACRIEGVRHSNIIEMTTTSQETTLKGWRFQKKMRRTSRMVEKFSIAKRTQLPYAIGLV